MIDRPRIESLTGLRILAAWMVFLHHSPIQALRTEALDVQNELHIGVSIFYVLSGFLISYRYDGVNPLSGRWLAGYWWARFTRIYPVYFALVLPVLLFRGSSDPGRWLINLTLTKGLFDDHKFSGIPQSWSLTVEECFYASAPFLFLLGRKQRFLWRAALVLVACAPAAMLLGQVVDTHGFLAPPRFVLLYTFFGRGLEFAAGMQLSRLLTVGALPRRRTGCASTLLGTGGVLVVLVVLALLETPERTYGLFSPMGILVNNLILPIFVALLLYGLVSETTVVKRLLESSPFVLLGQASYAFYLIHIGWIRSALGHAGITGAFAQFVALNCVAILIFLGFERPVQWWLRSIARPSTWPPMPRMPT